MSRSPTFSTSGSIRGSTHAFVIEARYGEGVRANLYCEGSDQHRGWFQSSLLESSATRGRAPFEAVLTHGFALDQDGRKMSKSIGNTVDPLAIIRDSGADILRLWVASTDYFEDVRIGKEILAGTSDAYRKLRNTFRYLLGALDGFEEAERLPTAQMPELERWVLHRLATLDAELREAADDFDFNRYTRLILTFANDDLSAFFFDIRKDSLYCDAPASPKRRAYRTVLDTVFHALVRWMSPVLCFTTEEVWGTRYPDGGSVHLLEWPEIDAGWRDEALGAKWDLIRSTRERVTEAIEPLRREKAIGSSLEAKVLYPDLALDLTDESLADLAEIYIVSEVAPGQRRGDRSDQDRPTEMRPLLAASARGGGGWRPLRTLRGRRPWLSRSRRPCPASFARSAPAPAALLLALFVFAFDQAIKWIVTYPLQLRFRRENRALRLLRPALGGKYRRLARPALRRRRTRPLDACARHRRHRHLRRHLAMEGEAPRRRRRAWP